MPIYQSTAFFQCEKLGWSESWFRNFDNPPTLRALSQADLGAQAIWFKRIAACGAEVKLTDTRTSFVDTLNDGFPASPNFVGNQAFHSAYPALAVLWRFEDSTGRYWKNVYLRGVDDNISMNGGIGQFANPIVAEQMNRFNEYTAAVVAGGWGYMARQADPALKKVGLSYAPDVVDGRYIAIKCQAACFPLEQVNTEQIVNFRNVNVKIGGSALNGRHTVFVDAQDACHVVTPMALFPHNGYLFTIQRFTPSFHAMTTSGPRKIVRHDTGRPFGAPRGRHPAVKRG